ncbi:hypothetical protein VaNZ11_002754, partial [Volvox africanus]
MLDDDDDDDDFFKDFKVDLDVDMLPPAPKSSASAAAAPAKAVPIAAATHIGSDAEDDMDVMDDADVDLLMSDTDAGAKVNAAEEKIEVTGERGSVQILPLLLPPTESAPGASVAPPTQNPQPQPQEVLVPDCGGAAQPCPPHAPTAETGEGYNAEAAAIAELPVPARAEPEPGIVLEPGGSGRCYDATYGEREACAAIPKDCVGAAAADPAPQYLVSNVAAEAMTADATVTGARESGTDYEEIPTPVVEIGTTAVDMEQPEGDPQVGQAAVEDAVGPSNASGNGDGNNGNGRNAQEMAQDAVGATILLEARPSSPSLAPHSNVSEIAAAPHLPRDLITASSHGAPCDGMQQLSQPAVAVATGLCMSGTRTKRSAATPNETLPLPLQQGSSKLPIQQRPALKAKLPMPLTQPQRQSQSPSQDSIAEVALATPVASAANLPPQAQTGSVIIAHAASLQPLSAAIAAPSVAVPPSAGAGGAIIANGNATGTPPAPNPARPLNRLDQGRLMGRSLVGGLRGPAASSPTLQAPLSLHQQPQKKPPVQLQQQVPPHHHQQRLSSQQQLQGSAHVPGTGMRPEAL